jgi:hypothetical protein
MAKMVPSANILQFIPSDHCGPKQRNQHAVAIATQPTGHTAETRQRLKTSFPQPVDIGRSTN